ncbi:MAG: TetR family transcriptional regulator, partial [Mesorhizobium sp.]
MDSSSKRKRTRGRLSREMIEDAAFEVIEREGLSGFSMRKLAAALGCEAMSIYHHFPSQAHLYETLVDRQMSALVVPDESLPWRERVRVGMQEFRRVATEHPSFA